MNILLTGANGFIGRHILRILRGIKEQPTIICPVRGLHDKLPELPRVEWVECDLTDLSAVINLPDTEYVVNAASMSQVADSLAFPGYFIRSNVDLMVSVLQYAERREVKRVVHLSTNEVGPNGTHRPTNPYGAAKAAQEDICSAFRASFDVPITVLRTRDVFGEHQQSWKLIPTIVRNIEMGKVTEIFGGPTAGRHWIHADNLGYAVRDIIEPGLMPHFVRNTYAVVGKRLVPHVELLQTIEQHVGGGHPALMHFAKTDRPGHEASSPELESDPPTFLAEQMSYEQGLRNTVSKLLNP